MHFQQNKLLYEKLTWKEVECNLVSVIFSSLLNSSVETTPLELLKLRGICCFSDPPRR